MELNNWFLGEFVSPSNMKLVNAGIAETIYGFAGGVPMVLNSVPSISGGTVSITAGYAYLGTTTDVAYISDTGTNILGAKVLAQSGISLVNANCYIYVKGTITPSGDNSTNTVTSTVYTSVNPADEGVKIADVVSGAITNIYTRSIPLASAVGGGVTSLNTLFGALTLAEGSNITITPSGGNTLTIASSGSGSGAGIVATGGTGVNRWWKFANDGTGQLIIQTFHGSGSGSGTPVTLPTAFSTTDYVVVEINSNQVGASNRICQWNNSTTQITQNLGQTLITGGAGACQIIGGSVAFDSNFIAIGY